MKRQRGGDAAQAETIDRAEHVRIVTPIAAESFQRKFPRCVVLVPILHPSLWKLKDSFPAGNEQEP